MAERWSGARGSREQALALLRSMHRFPGPYEFRVVVRPQASGATVSAVRAVLGADAELKVGERWSRAGTWVALHLRATVSSAEQVLDVYEVLQRTEGVATVM